MQKSALKQKPEAEISSLRELLLESTRSPGFRERMRDTSFDAAYFERSADSVAEGLLNYKNPRKLWSSILAVAMENAELLESRTLAEGNSKGMLQFFTVGISGELLRKGRFRALIDFGIYRPMAEKEPEFVKEKVEECLPNLEENVSIFLKEQLHLDNAPDLRVGLTDLSPLGAPGRGSLGAIRVSVQFAGEQCGPDSVDLCIKKSAKETLVQEEKGVGAKITAATHIEWTVHQIMRNMEPETYGDSYVLRCEQNRYLLMTIYGDEAGRELPTYRDIFDHDERAKRVFQPFPEGMPVAEMEKTLCLLSQEHLHAIFYGYGKALAYSQILGVQDRHEDNALVGPGFKRIEIDFDGSLEEESRLSNVWIIWKSCNNRARQYLMNLRTCTKARVLREVSKEKDRIKHRLSNENRSVDYDREYHPVHLMKHRLMPEVNEQVKKAEEGMLSAVKQGFADTSLRIHEVIRGELAKGECDGILWLLSNPPRVVFEDLVDEFNQPFEKREFEVVKARLVDFAKADPEAAIKKFWEGILAERNEAKAKWRAYKDAYMEKVRRFEEEQARLENELS